jgi:hypothetical protein
MHSKSRRPLNDQRRLALGRQICVALDEAVLHLDGAVDGVDRAAELDQCVVASALDDALMAPCNGRVDEVASQRPEPSAAP